MSDEVVISPTLGVPSANFKVMDAYFGQWPTLSHDICSLVKSLSRLHSRRFIRDLFWKLHGVLPLVWKETDRERCCHAAAKMFAESLTSRHSCNIISRRDWICTLHQGYGRKCELPRLGLALRKPLRASPPCISKPRFHKWGTRICASELKHRFKKQRWFLYIFTFVQTKTPSYRYANSQIQKTKLALKVRIGFNPDQRKYLAEGASPIHKYNMPDQD